MKTNTRTVKNDADRAMFIRYIGNINEYPFICSIKPGGEPRTNQQNRLGRLWVNEAANQGDMEAEEYRGYCKLHFGVPILLEDPDFAEQYNSVFKPLPYETKRLLMQEPFDFPVTRLMSTKQKKRYLDKMYEHFTGLGFVLTDPSLLGLDSIWRAA